MQDDTIAGVAAANTIIGAQGNDIIIPGADGCNIFDVNAQNLTPGNV